MWSKECLISINGILFKLKLDGIALNQKPYENSISQIIVPYTFDLRRPWETIGDAIEITLIESVSKSESKRLTIVYCYCLTDYISFCFLWIFSWGFKIGLVENKTLPLSIKIYV